MSGLTFADGNLYVVDNANNEVDKVTLAGVATIFAAGPAFDAPQFAVEGPAVVPEPSTLALFGATGAAAIAARLKRHRRPYA